MKTHIIKQKSVSETKTHGIVICFLLAVFLLTACEKSKEPISTPSETSNLSTQQVNDETNVTSQPILNATEDEISFTNEKWKLIAFVNVLTSTNTTPNPNNDNCYWLVFYDNDSLSGWSSTNDLSGSYTANMPSTPNKSTNSDKYSFQITKLGGTKMGELYDGWLFMESLFAVDSCLISGNELKLYYDNQNYLLFERR